MTSWTMLFAALASVAVLALVAGIRIGWRAAQSSMWGRIIHAAYSLEQAARNFVEAAMPTGTQDEVLLEKEAEAQGHLYDAALEYARSQGWAPPGEEDNVFRDSIIERCPNGFVFSRYTVATGVPVCAGECECNLPKKV